MLLLLFIIAASFLAPLLIRVLAHGFDDPLLIAKAVRMTRIMIICSGFLKNQNWISIIRQTKIFVYSKNRIFPKNPVFLKILCPKIYGTLLIIPVFSRISICKAYCITLRSWIRTDQGTSLISDTIRRFFS